MDTTKRKNIGMRIRYEDSSDWLINRCLMCCMKTSNDVRNYVLSYNNTFSFERQIIMMDGKLINEKIQTFDEMNVKFDSTFEVLIKKVILHLIPKTTVMFNEIEYKVQDLINDPCLVSTTGKILSILLEQSLVYAIMVKILYLQLEIVVEILVM